MRDVAMWDLKRHLTASSACKHHARPVSRSSEAAFSGIAVTVLTSLNPEVGEME